MAVAALGTWVDNQRAQTTTSGSGKNKTTKQKYTDEHILGIEGETDGGLEIDLGGTSRFGELIV
jgi:hypothetical protein